MATSEESFSATGDLRPATRNLAFRRSSTQCIREENVLGGFACIDSPKGGTSVHLFASRRILCSSFGKIVAPRLTPAGIIPSLKPARWDMVVEVVFWILLISGFASIVYRSGLSAGLVVNAAMGPTRSTGREGVNDHELHLPVNATRSIREEVGFSSSQFHQAVQKSASSKVVLALDVSNITEERAKGLFELADRDPRRALEIIRGMPASEQRLAIVRVIKAYAIGNLLWEDADALLERDSTTFEDMRKLFQALPKTMVALAEEGAQEIREIEREFPKLFQETDTESTVNRICIPLEANKPGRVQVMLGWTKVAFFRFNKRYFEIDDDSDSEDLRDLPSGAKVRLLYTRFDAKRNVQSACLFAAKRAGRHWVGFFFLGASSGARGSRIVDMDPFAVLAVREDGEYQVEYVDDARSAAVLRLALPNSSQEPESSVRIESLLAEIRDELKKRSA